MSFNQKLLHMWRIPQPLIEYNSFNHMLTYVSEQLKDPESFLKRVQELHNQTEIESFDILEFTDDRIFEYYSHPQRISDTIIGRVWSFRDITERKRAENALRESEQLLLQAHKMEAIGRLAAGIAHEINNPLAIINEKAGLMKDILEASGDLQKNKEKFLGLMNGIFDSVNRCRTITHRLLGFSRRIEVTDVFDLNESIKEVIGFIEKEIIYRNITLELDFQKEPLKIRSAKGQLQQVFLNIINNAVDAVEEKGFIKVSTNIKDKNTIHVKISDNGSGIPKDRLKHIFEPFYTTKEKGKGTGLGLSISYGIMQRLGGTILIESEINKGTTFIVEIPVKAEED